ncbi:MAG: tetratricopeptide repeat protein [Gemmatimonadota bacterium]|nr:tetratricopeptide repeat protein [Gemmatimonadota bacterium]
MDIRSKFAETLIELGELDRAKRELELILEGRPSFVGARVRLGVVHYRLGEEDEATKQWRRCLEDDPRDMRARAYLASVDGGSAEG